MTSRSRMHLKLWQEAMIHAVFWAPLIPLADAFAVELLLDSFKYGRMRLFGSFGFIFASVLIGYAVGICGTDSIILSLSLC